MGVERRGDGGGFAACFGRLGGYGMEGGGRRMEVRWGGVGMREEERCGTAEGPRTESADAQDQGGSRLKGGMYIAKRYSGINCAVVKGR